MIWLWILGIILFLILLLLLTRVGVQAAIHGGELLVDVRFGLFSFRILPSKKKSGQKGAAPKEKKQPSETDKKEQSMPKPSLSDILDAVKTLWPPLKRALNRTRKGIRIRPLILSVIVGAEQDPAAGAELYGYIHAGIWTGMPLLEEALVISDPSIHIGIDFENPQHVLEGDVGLSARVGTLLGVALTVAIPALRWFLRWRRNTKKMTALNQQADKPSAA